MSTYQLASHDAQMPTYTRRKVIQHRLSSAPLYPHFDVGCALTHHDQDVSSSPLRLQSPKPTLRQGCEGYAMLILCRILAAYGTVNLRTKHYGFQRVLLKHNLDFKGWNYQAQR